jgi:hypothetical protein
LYVSFIIFILFVYYTFHTDYMLKHPSRFCFNVIHDIQMQAGFRPSCLSAYLTV